VTNYLLEIQFLGFRLHGWAKQTDLKTAHLLLDKTIEFVLQHSNFKTMGSSRTDAKVSANQFRVLLSVDHFLELSTFLEAINQNLPPDLKLLDISQVEDNYNVLQPQKKKTYLYLFSFGEKAHPFSAPFMTVVQESLDLKLMQEGANCFEGEHNFINYVTKPSKSTHTVRVIEKCQIVSNTFYTANFFPKNSYALQITSNGFMRNQVRLIMGQLFKLGKGLITITDLENSLNEKHSTPFREIAPGSGLILHSIQ
jgi:tRNA pseudouridine38-40 synthase